MQGSLVMQLHGWRGFAREPQLFMTIYTAGWVSVGVSRFILSDRLKDLARQLMKLTSAHNDGERP